MGCDIHVSVEIKHKGKWLHYSQPSMPRDYQMFALMANVRNSGDHTPISEAKGLPEDITDATKVIYSYDEADAHSESWLSSEEFTKLIKTYLKKQRNDISFEHDYFGYLFGGVWEIEWKDEWPEGLEDYRIIFWFDN